ncbi:hypothetical protein RWV98_02995 [Agathobaculum sp. NTUH-O15-33]|uniref:hypothetical protein n=1 Tax=Agathobaculum sp. NTUH-O15-33 TaxID=3079302 RepID=UPI0029584A16|nr:hypothetical protein [Agathobaculum sp. NTUH-O15-33]WNX85259.1 hypothetical protein RWV98_02995 [Agathobaculum sp. NTUH-O15-33]
MTDFEFLSQRGRTVSYRYELLDKSDMYRRDLTTVINCTITYDAESDLKVSANIEMGDDQDVDYANDRIRVVCVVQCGGERREYPLWTFLLSSPARESDGTVAERNIEAYSKLQVYADDKVESRHIVTRGTNVVNEVIRLLGVKTYRLPASGLTLATDSEWEIGTPKLEIINGLLETINYTSLRVAADGYFEAEPYVLPADRTVDFAYIDDGVNLLGRSVVDDFDLFSVPNVFVRYVDNPDADPLRSVYVNDNPHSPSSTIARGRRITSCEQVKDVADQATLDDLTRRAASTASQIYSSVTFTTGAMPVHGFANIIRLRHGLLDGKYEEISWELPCLAGELMTHTARKVVQV